MKYAALYRDRNYEFGVINDEGRFEYDSSLNDNRFYVISDREFEIAKKFNIPNLGYNKLQNDSYEIFDKKVQEYYEYEVPVFSYNFDKLTPSKMKTLLSIPTKPTIKAAHEIYEKVMKKIFEYEHAEEIAKLYKKILRGHGIAFIKYEDYPYLESILYRFEDIEMLYNYQYESCIVGIKQNAPAKELKVTVPKALVASVIGKCGKTANEMSKRLGVKKIKVIGN